MSQQDPSNWQQKITGEWYGIPSVFDSEGGHAGFNKVSRSSVFEDNQTTYQMTTQLDASEPLRSRFEAQGFAFGVKDSDQDRIYMGPDFFGAGHPYGSLVDAHYYSPGWQADLRTMVHVLDDQKTQVYSSLLYDGPRICSVFNGVYKLCDDYDTNPESKKFIDDFLESEMKSGSRPHILPMKHEGRFTGRLAVYDAQQNLLGDNHVAIDYCPSSLLEAQVAVNLEGEFNRKMEFRRARFGHRYAYDGPDLCGNGIAYGRALYTSQHFKGDALKIKGREFIIDDGYTMSVVWQVLKSDRPYMTMYGVLNWEEGDLVLKATYK